MNFDAIEKRCVLLLATLLCGISSLLLTTGCRTVTREADLQFKPAWGGRYQGDMPGIGPVKAHLYRNKEDVHLDLICLQCTNHYPDYMTAKRWLSGAECNGNIRLTQDGYQGCPAIDLTCRIVGDGLAGFYTLSNSPAQIPLSLRRTQKELEFAPPPLRVSFPQRAQSKFTARIPVLQPTKIGIATDVWLRQQVLQQFPDDEEVWRPGFVNWLKAMWDGGYRREFTRDPEWTVQYEDENRVSLLCHDREYSGGAHGQTFIHTANFVLQDGELRAIKLPEFFNGTDWQEPVIRLVMADLTRQGATDVTHEAVEKVVSGERWVHDDEGVVFQFQEYEVGCFAEGLYQSRVRWNELKELGCRVPPFH